MTIGVAEGALIVLVLDRFINAIRLVRNGRKPDGNGLVCSRLDDLKAENERQTDLLIRANESLARLPKARAIYDPSP